MLYVLNAFKFTVRLFHEKIVNTKIQIQIQIFKKLLFNVEHMRKRVYVISYTHMKNYTLY